MTDRMPASTLSQLAAMDANTRFSLPCVDPLSLLHPDAEVNWSALHRASRARESDARCYTCGELCGDDRFHFIVEVTAHSIDPQMIEAAKCYELLLHRKRREIANLAVKDVTSKMFKLVKEHDDE